MFKNELMVKVETSKVNGNFEDVKTELETITLKYKGVVVTEEFLKDCKDMQKELGSLRKTVETKRKEIKAELEKPVKENEAKFKDLLKVIAEVEDPLKEGIKVFEDKKKEEKKEQIEELIKEVAEVVGIDPDKLEINDKYLNVTTTMKSIKADLTEKAEAIKIAEEQKANENELKKTIINMTLSQRSKETIKVLTVKDFEDILHLSVENLMLEANKRIDSIKEIESIAINVNTTEATKEVVNENLECYMLLEVKGSREGMRALGEFLSKHNFNYEVKDKGNL